MMLSFVTGNAEKFANAQAICSKFGFDVEQLVIDTDEIQGEDPELIVRDKVQRAYELIGKPVIVSDDSWNISALNGFPGPYMKSASHWFSEQNFIDILGSAEDRSVLLHQYLAYQDEHQTVLFTHDHSGTIVTSPKGNSSTSWHNVVSMDVDQGKTLGEIIAAGGLKNTERLAKQGDAWYSLLEWLKGNRQV